MALIHADGFDHWGSRANMEIGGWIYQTNQADNFDVSLLHARTGLYSGKFPVGVSAGYNRLKYIWDATQKTAGIGFAHFIASAYQKEGMGVAFIDLASNQCITILFDDRNSFTLYRLNLGDPFAITLGIAPPNVIAPGSYNYIEMKCTLGPAGLVQVLVNGVTVVAYVGLTAAADTVIGGVLIGKCRTSFSGSDVGVDTYIDDLVIWDASGARNNNLMGEIACATSFPSADTVTADWTPSAGGTGWNLINEVPPNTANYIQANIAGDISEFAKTGMTVIATGVAGVKLFALAAKLDAGPSTFRVGVNSASIVQNSPLIAPGLGYAFYSSVFELNPNGNVPWTKTTLDAANIRVTREA